MKNLFASLWVLVSTVSMAAPGSESNFKTKSGQIDFYVIGRPSMLKIHGEGKSIDGSLHQKESELTGKFTVKMANFETGMGLRDRHMRDKIFEVEKFPTSELILKSLNAKSGEKTKFSGSLHFHGVEKEIQGDASVVIEGEQIKINASFPMLLTDFGIAPPSFAGMKINNDVKVDVVVTATK